MIRKRRLKAYRIFYKKLVGWDSGNEGAIRYMAYNKVQAAKVFRKDYGKAYAVKAVKKE